MLGTTKARRVNNILRAYVYVYDPSITGVIGRLALMTGIVVCYDLRRIPEKRNATWVLEKEYILRKRVMWRSIRCGLAGIGVFSIILGVAIATVVW